MAAVWPETATTTNGGAGPSVGPGTAIDGDGAGADGPAVMLAPLAAQDDGDRPRPHLDLATHPVSDVLLMLSSILRKITQANDRLHGQHTAGHWPSLAAGDTIAVLPKTSPSVLAFHARNVPSISIQSYLTRILKYCPTTNEVFISILVYFDRMSGATKEPSGRADGSGRPHTTFLDIQPPTTNSAAREPQRKWPAYLQREMVALDSFNVHRMVIAGITISSKYCSDVFYTNSRYAKVGGLPLTELNHLELNFLVLLDFGLYITLEDLQDYGDRLLQYWLNEQRHEPCPEVLAS